MGNGGRLSTFHADEGATSYRWTDVYTLFRALKTNLWTRRSESGKGLEAWAISSESSENTR